MEKDIFHNITIVVKLRNVKTNELVNEEFWLDGGWLTFEAEVAEIIKQKYGEDWVLEEYT